MSDDAYVVMKHVSGKGKDSQWFDYRGGFTSPVTRVEWELGTMHIVLPAEEAAILIRNGHARPMTPDEIKEYKMDDAPPTPVKPESESAPTNEGG